MAKEDLIIKSQGVLSADPTAPDVNRSVIYPKTDGDWWARNADGTIKRITGQSSPALSNTQIAFGNTSNLVSGSTNLTFITGTNTVNIVSGNINLGASGKVQFNASAGMQRNGSSGIQISTCAGGGALFLTNSTFTADLMVLSDAGSCSIKTSLLLPIVNKSANYTVGLADHTINCTSASNTTITLATPAAFGSAGGRVFVIKNTGTGVVTVDPAGSTIDGAANYTLAQNKHVTVQYTGTVWIVIGNN
jgi:hypothetical protein